MVLRQVSPIVVMLLVVMLFTAGFAFADAEPRHDGYDRDE